MATRTRHSPAHPRLGRCSPTTAPGLAEAGGLKAGPNLPGGTGQAAGRAGRGGAVDPVPPGQREEVMCT
jgi:hypothetical protein